MDAKYVVAGGTAFRDHFVKAGIDAEDGARLAGFRLTPHRFEQFTVQLQLSLGTLKTRGVGHPEFLAEVDRLEAAIVAFSAKCGSGSAIITRLGSIAALAKMSQP